MVGCMRTKEASIKNFVRFVEDSFVRVEYEIGEYWCGKILHLHSKHLVIPSFPRAAVSHSTVAVQNHAPNSLLRSREDPRSIDAMQLPAHYKATALASQTPPELASPAGADIAKQDLRRTQTKISEADFIAHAVNRGRTSELPQLLDAAVARSLRAAGLQDVHRSEEEVVMSLLHVAMRACAAARRLRKQLRLMTTWQGALVQAA